MTTSHMQSPDQPGLAKRVRAFHTKTADGCKTCRIRRIKCDRAKPTCKKCSSTGRTCDGYPPGLSSPSETTKSSSLSSTGTSSSSPPTITISTNILEDDQECRSFSFFCKHTAPQLSGFFDSSDFWQRLLLQAAHHEPAVRHAAIALGALHERFETLPHSNLNFTLRERKHHDVFVMQQYSKAIKALLGSNEGQEQAADVALVTCVLFIYFETLRGHHATAVSHINGGIKILSSLHKTSSPSSPSLPPRSKSNTPYVSTATLTLLFIRFDTQASAILADRARALPSPSFSSPPSGYCPDIPEIFGSLEEARNSLDYIRMESWRSMDNVDRTDMVGVRVMLACVQSAATLRLRLWDQGFTSLVKRGEFDGRRRDGGDERDNEWREAVNVLKVQRIFMNFYFCVDLERAVRDEGLWDEYTSHFEEVVRLSEAIVGNSEAEQTFSPSETSTGNGSAVRRVLCLDAGIILPLYFVATKCRVRSIRWKAIELLRRTERQEGLWNSVLTALVAERLVRIEEEGLVGEELEREKRIRGVEVRFELDERRACLRYGRLKAGVFGIPFPAEMEWIEGWICW